MTGASAVDWAAASLVEPGLGSSAGAGSSVQSQFQLQIQTQAQSSVSAGDQFQDQSPDRVHDHVQLKVPATGADPAGSVLVEIVPWAAVPSPFHIQSQEVTSEGIW